MLGKSVIRCVWWQTAAVCTTAQTHWESDAEELTLFVFDGNRQETDEGHDCQQREEHSDEEEELESLQPGSPEVLQVHDVSNQSPKCQHTWGTNTSED